MQIETIRVERLDTTVLRKHPSIWWKIGNFIRKKPLGAFGLALILILAVAALGADLLYPDGPNRTSGTINALPGGQFLLGSDNLGRDVLARIVFGTRTSLSVGFIAVAIGVLFGTLVGLVSGYAGGKVDLAMQRVVDAMMAFPGLVLALSLVAVFGQNMTTLMFAIGVGYVPILSRVVRGTVLSAKQNQYVEASRCLGCRSYRILFVHILPNILAPVIILATAGVGAAISAEATLSYLGLGTPPPNPTWGGMMQDGRKYMYVAWWLTLYPGMAISIAVYGFNFFGDALRDILDPKLRGR